MRYQNIHINKENITNGGRMIATGIRPAYEYTDGKRGNKVIGMKITVALEQNSYDTLTVTVADTTDRLSALLEKGDGPVYVDFTGFTARIYTMNGVVGVSAKADSVIVVTDDMLTVDIS